jgi:hypothetical protein
MLDRLDALERDVRMLLMLEPIRAEILKRDADNAYLQAKGQEDARNAETERQDKLMEADTKNTEARAKQIEETDPDGAEQLRTQLKVRQEAHEQRKTAAEAAAQKAEESKRTTNEPGDHWSDHGILTDDTYIRPTAPPVPPESYRTPVADQSFHSFQHPDPIAAAQAGETQQGPRP